jgi:hypothetical protein
MPADAPGKEQPRAEGSFIMSIASMLARYWMHARRSHHADHNAPRSKPLLDTMILRLGLEKDFAFGGPTLSRDIERRCATCPTQALCSRWLGKGGAPDEYRLFCPNAGNFDLLTGKAAA